MDKNSYKTFGTICVLVYAFVALITSDPLGSVGSSVSIALVLYCLYSRFFWKYNPLEKMPRIAGVYHATHQSSYYPNGRTFCSEITIRQTLHSVSVSILSDSGHGNSISANFSQLNNGTWRLIYTYETHPKAQPWNVEDDAHFGTCLLYCDGQDKLSGTYFTGRQKPTIGHSVLVRTK